MTASVPATVTAPERPRLFTVGFGALLAATFFGFAGNFMTQPVLTLLVQNLGGDVALAGFAVAAFSFPSLILRPLFGRLADERSIHGSWWVGAAVLVVANAFYVIPSLIVLFGVRVLNGIGWAAFNVGGHTTVAKTTPPSRRGEATGMYNLVIGLAQVTMPGIALLLADAYGLVVPFLAAAVLALIGLAIIRFGPVPVATPSGKTAARLGRAPGRGRDLLERGAIMPMFWEFLFSSSVPLYFAFLPVFGAERGIPIDQLAVFYPVYGVVFIGVRTVSARFMDRIGRRILLAVSVGFAIVGLGLGFFATDLGGIILSGVFYALGASLSTPTAMALAIDRTDSARMGSAMATYSLGYQLALGVGAAVFGVIIDLYHFPAPFLVAVGTQLVLAALLVVEWRRLPGGRRRGPQGPVGAGAA